MVKVQRPLDLGGLGIQEPGNYGMGFTNEVVMVAKNLNR